MSSIDRTPEVLNAISVFVQVAQLRSFTAAAHKLGMTASGVSKAVTRLEEKLGVQLAKRTTRSVSLTNEGAAYAERCQQILAELDEAAALVTRAQQVPRGTLRIQLPAAEGRNAIIPHLPRFMREYPDLALEIELSGRAGDLSDKTIDCAVRIGEPPDVRLVARKICDLRYVICASPGYLARRGQPMNVADLMQHDALMYLNPLTGRRVDWQYLKDGALHAAPVQAKLSANGIQTLVDAAVADAGLVYAATAVVSGLIGDGRLQRVLPDLLLPSQPMLLLYPPNRQLSPRIRAFAHFLSEIIPAVPSWDAATH